jgi:hypothetical protein
MTCRWNLNFCSLKHRPRIRSWICTRNVERFQSWRSNVLRLPAPPPSATAVTAISAALVMHRCRIRQRPACRLKANNDRSHIFKRQTPRLASLLRESHYDCVGDNSGGYQHTPHHIIILWALCAGIPVIDAANTRGLSLQNPSRTEHLGDDMSSLTLGNWYPDELTFFQPILHQLFCIPRQFTVQERSCRDHRRVRPEVDTNPSNG